jgi:hypothetical protein|nr:MAG TPA: hypothetical protein [Microviridae sp.]
MFVIMTDFIVHFYVENLLKVLKLLKTNLRACARARFARVRMCVLAAAP